ncbi:MAG: dephospho-CoA kinase [Lachnospiraceae bacterium]|nr:dephospho-CoA kinase [Lachnospiraceae bacterium]
MVVIGLTGGSGVGKGFVSELFLQRGIPALDTDKVSRAVCEKGSPCLNELVSVFGEEILLPDGSYHRKKMGEIVYSDPVKRAVLNEISHRYILSACREWLKEKEKEGFPAAIIDAPLLYESGFDRECDVIVAVSASRETRISRITGRDGISEEIAGKRIDAQLDTAFYLLNGAYMIYNQKNKTREALLSDIDRILKKIGVTDADEEKA